MSYNNFRDNKGEMSEMTKFIISILAVMTIALVLITVVFAVERFAFGQMQQQQEYGAVIIFPMPEPQTPQFNSFEEMYDYYMPIFRNTSSNVDNPEAYDNPISNKLDSLIK